MNTPQQSILERSTNDGDSWEGIDSAFGSGNLFLLPQVGVDDTTLAISVWSHVPGQDHEGALVLLQKSGLTGLSIGRHLKRILSVKNKAQYASVRCTRTDAEQCLKRASRIQDLILEYLVPDESEK